MEGNLTTGKQQLYLLSHHWAPPSPPIPKPTEPHCLLLWRKQDASEHPSREHSFEVVKQVKNNLLGQIHKFFLMWIFFYGSVIQPFTIEVKCFFNTITELLKWMLI